MPTEVPGQLFGYSLQYPRAYLRLLEIPDDACVSIEDIGDVGVFYSDGSKLVEEDKSTIRNVNTLSDKSTNLWKTIYNWLNKIKNGVLNDKTDKFILYTNHLVSTDSIVQKLNQTFDNISEIDEVITEINSIKESSKVDSDIYKYINSILEETNIIVFKKLLKNFELITDKKADNVYEEIEKRLIHDLGITANQTEIILQEGTGWLQKQFMEKAANHKDLCIKRIDYMKFIKPFYNKVLVSELIDYACSKSLTNEQQLSILGNHPTYVRQLELINLETDDILEAINDYYKSEINRDKWNEDGILSLEDLQTFKSDLISSYKQSKRIIDIRNSNNTDIDKGQLLYSECQQKDIKLAQKIPPSKTVQGTYHLLSDEKELGWHPDWKNKLK